MFASRSKKLTTCTGTGQHQGRTFKALAQVKEKINPCRFLSSRLRNLVDNDSTDFAVLENTKVVSGRKKWRQLQRMWGGNFSRNN